MTSNTVSSSSHASAGPESATPSIAEDEEVAVASVGFVDNAKSGPQIRKLSTVSKMYDVDGDGELDDAEAAMRGMDKSNRGYLTNDKVYNLMLEQIALQRQFLRVKRIMFVLLALVVVLAISNLGTSFAAASLAKETTTSSNAEVIDKNTNEALSTQSSTSTYEIERTTITPEGERKLLTDTGSDDAIFTIDKKNCKQIYKQCKRGNDVTLFRMWRNGARSDYDLCPSTGTFSRNNKSTLINRWGETFTIEPIGDGHCEISGGAVLQKEGDICENLTECGPGMSCRRVEQFIAGCQRRCALRRFAAYMVEECKVDCDHSTCQALEMEY